MTETINHDEDNEYHDNDNLIIINKLMQSRQTFANLLRLRVRVCCSFYISLYNSVLCADREEYIQREFGRGNSSGQSQGKHTMFVCLFVLHHFVHHHLWTQCSRGTGRIVSKCICLLVCLLVLLHNLMKSCSFCWNTNRQIGGQSIQQCKIDCIKVCHYFSAAGNEF